MDVDIVRIGNRTYSAKSVSISAEGVPYVGITGIKGGQSIEKDHVHGMNKDGAPLALTSGKYVPKDLVVTMLKDVFMTKYMTQLGLLCTAIGSPGSYGVYPLTWVVQYAERGLAPTVDTYNGCELVDEDESIDEGSGALVIALTYKIISMSRNGLTIYDRTRIP